MLFSSKFPKECVRVEGVQTSLFPSNVGPGWCVQ